MACHCNDLNYIHPRGQHRKGQTSRHPVEEFLKNRFENRLTKKRLAYYSPQSRHATNHAVPTYNFVIRLKEGHFGPHCIVEKMKLLRSYEMLKNTI